MLQGILLLLVGVLVFIAIVVMIILRLIAKGLGAFFRWNKEPEIDDTDSTRRRNTQYTYTSRRESSDRNRQSQSSPSTIIDTRDPARAQRKIFNDDEGEYVDYSEE